MKRWLAIGFVALVLVVALSGVLSGPWSTLVMQLALPRQHGDLHLLGYHRGGPAPGSGEGIRFLLPRESARAWYGAAIGWWLPAAAAEPGTVLWGEVRGAAVGAPLTAQAISAANGAAPRLDLVLAASRVNAWLLAAAVRDRSPWVVRVAAGSRISDSEVPAEAGWDLALQVALSGLAARRDGQAGLVHIEEFTGRIDLRWSPGVNDTRVESRVRIERLRLSDPRSGIAGEVPTFLLELVAEAINKGLRDQPPVLPFVVPREVRLSVEVVELPASGTPAF